MSSLSHHSISLWMEPNTLSRELTTSRRSMESANSELRLLKQLISISTWVLNSSPRSLQLPLTMAEVSLDLPELSSLMSNSSSD